MRNVSILLAGILAAIALVSGTHAQQRPAFEVRFAELINQAKAEGELTWYQGLLESPGKDFSTHFQQRFGIRVQHQFMPSGPIFERFRTESVSGRHIADVFSSGDTGPMLDAMKNGFIAKYDAASKGDFPKGWVLDHPHATAYPTQRVQMAVAYNTQLVKPEDAKELSAWKGLLDPRFANGIISLGDPGRSVTAFPLYYYWTKVNPTEYGDDFLAGLAAQKPVVYASHTQQSARIGAGEVAIGVIVDIVAIQQYDLGAPIAIVYPSPSPNILQYSAISKNAPHPKAAQLFLEYLSSEEGLAEYKRFSGGLTGRPDLDASIKAKYTMEPWYNPPKEFYVLEDWDTGNREYRSFVPKWRATFQKQ